MPRRCATVRRTDRCCECPCATTDRPDHPGRAPPGWVRWPAAGSTARTGTTRPARVRRCARRGRRTPRWAADRRCRPDTPRPPRPPRRRAAPRRTARIRSSGPRPRTDNTSRPGRSTSARGTTSSTAAVTPSKWRASRPGSAVATWTLRTARLSLPATQPTLAPRPHAPTPNRRRRGWPASPPRGRSPADPPRRPPPPQASPCTRWPAPGRARHPPDYPSATDGARPLALVANRTRLIRPHPGVGAPAPAPVIS